MKKITPLLLLLALVFMMTNCQKDTTELELILQDEEIEDRGFNGFVHTDVSTFGPFLPAGPEGGGVLVPGTMFPPNGRANRAMLRRGSNWIQANALTSGLPPGAYTMWWVIFNNPSSCISPIPGLSLCGEADLGNPAAETSIFWADGNIVTANGLGAFSAQVAVGDDLGTPGQHHVFGP